MENNTQTASITESQRQKLIAYLEEARSTHMHFLYIAVAGSVLCAVPGLMLMFGISGGRYVTLAGVFWFVCIIGLVVLLLTGWQKVFGNNCPLSQVKRNEYTCEYITVSRVSDHAGKPPYLLDDSLGNQFICPVYLEFKQLRAGSRAIGVYLSTGSRYAFGEPTEDIY